MKHKYINTTILFGSIFFLVLACSDSAKENHSVETVVVEERTMDNTISVNGNLKPAAAQDIRSPITGQVSKVHVKVGEYVAKNQMLISMDSASARYELDRISYDLDAEKLRGNNRRVALLEAEYKMRLSALDALTIRAQFNGIVTKLNIAEGDVLSVGTSYGRVIDAGRLIANVEIAEMDIGRVKTGLDVNFTFTALPGVTAHGKLVSFTNEAYINARGVVVLDAVLAIDKPAKELLPGLSFDAAIIVGENRKILVLESRAIVYKSGKPEVEKQNKDGTTQKIPIITEGFGAGYVRIVSGLNVGDEIVVPAQPKQPMM